jgi:cytochrome c-type biogenesis protein CcmE
MLTKKVKKRFSFLTLFLTLTIFAVFFILKSLNNNILYFKTPTDIKSEQDIVFNKQLRVGGMVKQNSLKIDNEEIKFTITDLTSEIFVSYAGTVPNLFAEGKGVVAEGKLKDKNFFVADRILAKHDENYMPPELKKIMEKNVK